MTPVALVVAVVLVALVVMLALEVPQGRQRLAHLQQLEREGKL